MKYIWQVLRIIKNHIKPLPAEEIPLAGAVNRFALEDIYASELNPPFPMAAMDGYAFNYDYAIRAADAQGIVTLELYGELYAGSPCSYVPPDKAILIMTGAPVPPEMDTVIELEKAHFDPSTRTVRINIRQIKRGRNVRPLGGHFSAGTCIVKKGTRITPSVCALLAAAGISRVKVSIKPNVKVIITGNELALPGDKRMPYQLYESNGTFLKAWLSTLPVNLAGLFFVCDDIQVLKGILSENSADIAIITGGVSKGKKDFTTKALLENDFNILFHGVHQKPGKPLLLATRGKTIAIGLPGNPRAVIVSSWLYVSAIIKLMMGAREWLPPAITAKNTTDISISGRTTWIPVSVKGDLAFPSPSQESHHIIQLREATGFVCAAVPLKAGDKVKVRLWG